MNNRRLLYIKDNCRNNDMIRINGGNYIDSVIRFINDDSGEDIFEPIHNRTVIAGAGFTLQKLFNLDKSVLNNTPTYDEVLELDDASSLSSYPTISIVDDNNNVVGSMNDESQRFIIGWCVGIGGAGGVDGSTKFHELYASWITPDNLVPFRYPLESADTVDESIYKGKKTITLSNGQTRCAYYFKEFTNTPTLVQNYLSSTETFADQISKATVYESSSNADRAQSFVELHCKITSKDCREFFIAHGGIEQAKINQISLLTGWKKTVSKTKYNTEGNMITKQYETFQQVRPFSLCNFRSQPLSDKTQSISILYTLYC